MRVTHQPNLCKIHVHPPPKSKRANLGTRCQYTHHSESIWREVNVHHLPEYSEHLVGAAVGREPVEHRVPGDEVSLAHGYFIEHPVRTLEQAARAVEVDERVLDEDERGEAVLGGLGVDALAVAERQEARARLEQRRVGVRVGRREARGGGHGARAPRAGGARTRRCGGRC